MAKKRIENEPIEDNEPDDVQYESIEPEAVEDTYTFDEPPTDGLAIVGNFDPQELVAKPGGPAVVLDTDDDLTRVSFLLPRRVLFALVDPSHSEADVVGATERGLMYLTGYEGYSPYDATAHLTELGQLVLGGCDVTAIRHSMLAGYRAAQNKAVDNDKTGFKRG